VLVFYRLLSRGIVLLCINLSDVDGWWRPRHGCCTQTGQNRYPLYRKLGGPQGRFGRMWKISPPPGFDPRTVQPVANRYNDYAVVKQFHESDSYSPYFHNCTKSSICCKCNHLYWHCSSVRLTVMYWTTTDTDYNCAQPLD